ncbi:MAG: hypothetical protein CGW95_13790 [Phenylobacterium zucineum]|nr:MAG: hypothetical protein CGW95_13790 [Phenylobacterium zucineum]
MQKLNLVLVSMIGVLVSTPSLAQSVSLDWSVVDRFRLFKADSVPASMAADPGLSIQDEFLEKLAASSIPTTPFPESGRYAIVSGFLGHIAHGRGPMDGHKPFEVTRWSGQGPTAGQAPSALRRYESDYLYPQAYAARVKAVGVTPGDQCVWETAKGTLPLPCSQAIIVPTPARTDHAGSMPTVVKVTVTHGGGGSVTSSVTIEIKDRLFIGLGESYASGEGNPDQPQHFDDPRFQEAARSYFSSNPDPYERWWRDEKVLATLTQPAQWWDPVCHRSLYSQQANAAFLYAAARPKEAVTFAAFACSGAEVLDGLIAGQVSPPGLADFGPPNHDANFKMVAQVEQALSLLCRNNLAPDAERASLEPVVQALGMDKKAKAAILQSASVVEAKCAQPVDTAGRRKVDMVLISIGGNDVGFSGAVKTPCFPSRRAIRLASRYWQTSENCSV